MVCNKFRMSVALAATLLTFIDVASAVPIAPPPASIGVSPTLAQVRGHRGGFHGGGHRGGFHGGGYHGGYHGGYRGGHNVYRGGHNVYVGGGGWRRSYGWAPGGAIAAGAAIGFLTAGTAMAIASSRLPASGLCWYYTDASQRAGFWDNCPR
ncbi:MAG: hypothetical protein WB816_04065 [Methylocystis sp.]